MKTRSNVQHDLESKLPTNIKLLSLGLSNVLKNHQFFAEDNFINSATGYANEIFKDNDVKCNIMLGIIKNLDDSLTCLS